MELKPPPGTRLKELVSLEGVRDNQLIGYGLVVGLFGTGDHQQTLPPKVWGIFSSRWESRSIQPWSASPTPPPSW